MKRKKRIALLAVLLIVTALLTGCLPNKSVRSGKAGFLQGVWHGWMAPISLICEACGMGTQLFETDNTGLSYELGFYMAVISGFGGLTLCRKRKKKHKD